MSQEAYTQKKYKNYVEQHGKLAKERKRVLCETTLKKARKLQMLDFIAKLKRQDNHLTEFDEKLWSTILVVKSEHEVVFK
jgi:hypothetical protein